MRRISPSNTRPDLYPARECFSAGNIASDDELRPSVLSFTVGQSIKRLNGNYVRLSFEATWGKPPDDLRLRYEVQAGGRTNFGARLRKEDLLKMLNVPRLPPTARLVERWMGWDDGTIKDVLEICVSESVSR